MEFLRSQNEVDVRELVDERLTSALRHTTHEPENGVRTASARFCRHAMHLTNRFLLSLIANTAGIQQDDIRLLFRRSQLVAFCYQLRGNGLGIPLVHLAAISLDKYARHDGSGVVGLGT